MNNRNNGSPLRPSNASRGSRVAPAYRTVKKLSRLSSAAEALEPLESRTLMSAVALTVPSGISIAVSSPTTVNLAWADSGSKQTGYKVLRSTNAKNYTQVAVVTSRNTMSYTDTTVSPHVSYTYKIEAYSGKTNSAAIISATVKTPLVAPTGLSATLSGTKVVLKWTDNDTTAGGYNIFRSVNGGSFSQSSSVTGKSTNTFSDATIGDGKSFSYEVQAYSAGNTSVVSGAVSVTTPLLAPSNVVAAAQSSTWLHLSWTDNDSAATGYQILRSTDAIHYTTIATLTNGTTNSFDDQAVSSFSSYYYQVQATTSALASPVSSAAIGTTPLATPTWVMPVSIGANAIQFTWADTDPNARGYIILQAVGNGAFSQVATISSGSTHAWTDTAFTTNAQYSFEIEAVNGTATSPASSLAPITTPLVTPTGLRVTASSGTSVQLTWTDSDPNATGYTIFRSVNGTAFQVLTTVTGATVSTYTDGTAISGHLYSYDVIATAGANASAAATPATAVTPITAPVSLQSSASSATSVSLSWNNQDSSAVGYNILRSSDGITFVKIASVSGQAISAYVDAVVSSGHRYYYQVQALNSYTSSALSNISSVSTPMLAPTGLSATGSGTTISLSWTDNDSSATGYAVLRSTDGVSFTQLVQLNGATVHSYADTTVAAGQKYYYQVNATAPGFSSPASNTASFTIATQLPTSPTSSSVSVSPLWGNELVVTATGSSDTISISQSGQTLTILADGQTTTTSTLPSGGLFVYTRGGTDSINIAQSVAVGTTLEAIDTGVDTITSAGLNVTAWIDATDIFTGTGTVRSVSSFAGGVSKNSGASLPDPTDSGSTSIMTGSLFGTGPVAGDVNQGEVGDCYFLSSLAAFANLQPKMLEQSAVDMNDGTYVVRYLSGSTPTYLRVNADMPTGYGGNLYARTGSSGSIWVPVMEKAYAYFRTGANTYNSLNSGWMGNVYSAFGVNNTAFFPSSSTASAFFTEVSNDLANGKAVTLGTGSSTPQLVSDHAYTLMSATMVNGVATYVVRNPWGVQGDSLENSQGYATLTFAQLEANFVDVCEAT